MQDPAFGLPRIHLPRTPVNRGKSKGRSPDMEPRPSARAAYGEPTLLLDLELPVLALVALYVRVLVERVARQVLCPARHRGLVGPPRAEVARWVEGRLLGCGVVTDGGRNPGGGAVRVEPDQLEASGGYRARIPVVRARVHSLREGSRDVDSRGYPLRTVGRAGAHDLGLGGVGRGVGPVGLAGEPVGC